MLIRFTVKNFASFLEEQSLSMLKGKESKLPHHINSDESAGFKTLRGAVIYGANASGKSSLLEAMRYARTFIVRNKGSNRSKAFKLDSIASNQPSSFNFEFKIDGKAYSYGFESMRSQVIKEWLYEISANKRDKLLFERLPKKGEKANIRFGRDVLENVQNIELKDLEATARTTPDDTLFLYDAKRRNINLFLKPFEWFEKKLLILRPDSSLDSLEFFSKKRDEFIEFLTKLLNAADVGINSIELKRDEDLSKFDIPNQLLEHIQTNLSEDNSGSLNIQNDSKRINLILTKEKGKLCTYRMVTVHKVKNGQKANFELDQESDGTRRLIELAPAFFSADSPDRVLVIDEMDRSLHPKITDMLHDAHYTNSKRANGQLILATHEHYLLSQTFYRRDEIWFMEKDRFGESRLYSLSEYKIRHDKDIEKDYLLGRYGATPYVRKLNA